MGQFAWVTLATNDSYALGALVVAHSLIRAKTAYQLAVLITPGVTQPMREKLQSAFNLVQEVNVLDSKDAANLALLSRPELGITFTKLHCWRLTQYEKCVFLDADTLVLQNSDELFDREELSAAPDVGWPDCFNSGVFVFRPNLDTFDKLTQFAVQKGSFDGGDQGLLNSYFANWAQSDSSRRLPFIYNTCSTACYSYLPAFKQFGENVKILHFIGQLKPWVINFDPVAKKPNLPQEYKHLTEYLDLWWSIFCNDVHPKLVTDMGGLAGALAGLKLGVARSPEQEAYENNCRRNYWEHGNIDYLGSTIKERTVQETTADGRQITRVIHTLEGTQFEEVEEYEKNQAGEKKLIKRTTPGGNKKRSPAAEAALKALVSQEIVIVPGHTKVEFDEKNNIKTITEKTTSGHQVTTIQTFPDGRSKTQTRTFYDPISVPVGEDEEYEEEEEEEIIEENWEPSSKNTQVTSTNENQQAKNVNQQQVSKNTSNVNKQQQQTSTQQTSKQTTQQQTTVTQQTSSKTTSETQVTKSQQEQHQHQQHQKSIQNTQNTQNTQKTQNQQIVKKDDNTNLPVGPVGVPGSTTIVKKKLDTGEEIEIHTTISLDGKTKSCRRIVTKPAEELEVTEYEETTSYEPHEVKVQKTSQQSTTKKVQQSTETTESSQQHHQQQHHQQQTHHQETIKNQQQTTKNQTNVTDQQQHQQLKNVDTKNQTTVAPYGQNPDEYVAAQHSTRRTKVTESVTMIVQDEHGTSGVTKTKQTVNKEQNVLASQTGKQDLSTTQNQTTVSEEEHVLSVEEIEQLLQRQNSTDTKQITQEISSLTKDQIDQLLQHHNKTTQQVKQTHQSQHTKQTTQHTSTLTQEQVEELKRLQQIKITQQTQQTKNTQQTQQIQQTQQQQQTQQTTQKTKLTQEQIEKQERELRQQLEQQKQNTNVDQRFTKNQNQTIRTETHKVTHTSEKTFTTTMGHVVTRPDILPGEDTTEEVRYFPGGVEYVWKTVRSDGSSKMSMRTFYDPVPVDDEETTTEGPYAKKKLPAAHASNPQSGLRK